MKKNHFLITLILGLLVISVTPSCKKYEEGPRFSLRSKKERVANTWKIDQALFAGVVVPMDEDLANIRFEFTKDGDAKTYDATAPSQASVGTWDFASDKEVIRVVSDGEITDFTILKLKEKELWVELKEDGLTMELHLIPA